MSETRDNPHPAPQRGQCRAVFVDRWLRPGAFWLRFRRRGTQIREMATWFESRAVSMGLAGEDDFVRVAISPQGQAIASHWPERETADLAPQVR